VILPFYGLQVYDLNTRQNVPEKVAYHETFFFAILTALTIDISRVRGICQNLVKHGIAYNSAPPHDVHP
jgi:hypothetical protein